MGGDEGKDIQRDTVYANERVPPLADIRQCSRNVPVELRDIIECGAAGRGNQRIFFQGLTRSITIFLNIQWRVRRVLQLLVQRKNELRKRQALARVSTCLHGE